MSLRVTGANKRLENTEKNGKSRETGNIKMEKNTTQYGLDTIIRKQTQIT